MKMNTEAFHDPYTRNVKDIICPLGLGPLDAAKLQPGPGIMRTFEQIRDQEQKEYSKQPDLILAAGCAVGLDADKNCAHFYAGRVAHFIGFLLGQTENHATVKTRGSINLKIDGVANDDTGRPVYCTAPNEFSLTKSPGAAEIGAVRYAEGNNRAAVAFRRYDSNKPLDLII